MRRFGVGDRVTIPFHLACGHCEYCETGRSNICQAHGFLGVHTGGGFGELSLIPKADVNLVRLPDGVSPTAAAALGCRYMTAYHGLVDQARVRPGEWVAVFGIGGVGLATVQIARALGAQVIAVSRTQKKLDLAAAEGASATVVAGDTAVAAIRVWASPVRVVLAGRTHVSGQCQAPLAQPLHDIERAEDADVAVDVAPGVGCRGQDAQAESCGLTRADFANPRPAARIQVEPFDDPGRAASARHEQRAPVRGPTRAHLVLAHPAYRFSAPIGRRKQGRRAIRVQGEEASAVR